MEVIILAGGLGTRLQAMVNDVPKPMAPINGKPFLKYVLTWLTKYPIEKVILSTGYKAEKIKQYFGTEFLGTPLEYAVENEPLGTGGAIINALKLSSRKHILIVNGDTYFPIDVVSLFNFHIQSGSKVSLALKEMEMFNRYGTVNLENGLITSFNEKEYHLKGLINGGIYIVDKLYLDELNLPQIFSFEKQILEKEVEKLTLTGKIYEEEFIDIGIPEDYLKACKEL